MPKKTAVLFAFAKRGGFSLEKKGPRRGTNHTGAERSTSQQRPGSYDDYYYYKYKYKYNNAQLYAPSGPGGK
jgi:hypothetical protein